MVKFEGLILVSEMNKPLTGDPEDIQLTGHSAGVCCSLPKHRYHAYLYALGTGAHSVHQLLHHASQLPNGKKAPFHSAIMQSNAIL